MNLEFGSKYLVEDFHDNKTIFEYHGISVKVNDLGQYVNTIIEGAYEDGSPFEIPVNRIYILKRMSSRT